MTKNERAEWLVETTVTFTLAKDGKFYIIENVPARVNQETGEEFFSIKTVERLQAMIWDNEKPVKVVETPVYSFA
jgi:hypothetical protein